MMKKILIQILIIIVAGIGIYYCINKLFTGYDAELGGQYQVKVVALEANNEETAAISFRLASNAESDPVFQTLVLDSSELTVEMRELAPYWIEIIIPDTKLKEAPANDFMSGALAAPSEKEKVGILTYMILGETSEQTIHFYTGFSSAVELVKSNAAKTNLTLSFARAD